MALAGQSTFLFVATLHSDERVAIVDLADELHVQKQWIFKILRRLGIRSMRRRDASRGNQSVATVTAIEATAIHAEIVRVSAGARVDAADSPVEVLASYPDDVGAFYIIQLEPQHDPTRVKVGFATDLDGRVRKHRTAAPFARCVANWPSKRTWERAAIDCITIGCEQIHTEVFRAASLDQLVERGSAFFGLMPKLALDVARDEPEAPSRAG